MFIPGLECCCYLVNHKGGMSEAWATAQTWMAPPNLPNFSQGMACLFDVTEGC